MKTTYKQVSKLNKDRDKEVFVYKLSDNKIRVVDMERVNRESKIINIGNGKYIVKSTGEIREYKQGKKFRSGNMSNLYRSFRELGLYIDSNFDCSSDELMVTVTFSDLVSDLKKCKRFVNAYIRKMRYKHDFEYVVAYEIQARCSWHAHILVKDVVDVDKFKDLAIKGWKKGSAAVSKVSDMGNPGAYLCACLNNLIDEETKAVTKGARARLYPAGARIFSKSNGIIKAERLEMTRGELEKLIEDMDLTYNKALELWGDDGVLINRIGTEIYERVEKPVEEPVEGIQTDFYDVLGDCSVVPKSMYGEIDLSHDLVAPNRTTSASEITSDFFDIDDIITPDHGFVIDSEPKSFVLRGLGAIFKRISAILGFG